MIFAKNCELGDDDDKTKQMVKLKPPEYQLSAIYYQSRDQMSRLRPKFLGGDGTAGLQSEVKAFLSVNHLSKGTSCIKKFSVLGNRVSESLILCSLFASMVMHIVKGARNTESLSDIRASWRREFERLWSLVVDNIRGVRNDIHNWMRKNKKRAAKMTEQVLIKWTPNQVG